MVAFAICSRSQSAVTRTKSSILCSFACIFLSVIHLLLELLRLLLIHKRQTSETLLKLERMEKGAVLIVGECVVYLLIPYDASVGWLSCDSAFNLHHSYLLYPPKCPPV